MSDVRTVANKEWRELLRMGGSRRSGILRHVFSVAILSVLWPWQFGVTFLTTNLSAALAALTAAIYIAGAAPDSFAGERERHTLETLLATRLPDRSILFGKILALLEYGFAATVVMLLSGWTVVNLVHGDGELLLYSATALRNALIFAPLTAGFTAAVGVHVSLRAKTVKQAQQTFSTAALLFTIVPVLLLSAMGQERVAQLVMYFKGTDKEAMAMATGAVMLIAQIILFALAPLRFKRNKLT